jgi:hypothetical protein
MNRFIASSVIGLALFATIATPSSAHAAGLSSTQVQAILSLLSSFGADTATIAKVNEALGGAPISVADVDLKINGSDGVLTIDDASRSVMVSWTTGPNVSTCQLAGIKDQPWSKIQQNNATFSAFIDRGALNASTRYTSDGSLTYGVYLQCVKTLSGVQRQVSDEVPLKFESATPTVTIELHQPASNAQLPQGKPFSFVWSVANAPKKSQVEIEVQRVPDNNPNGAALEVWRWQSSELPTGYTTGSHASDAWDLGSSVFPAGTYHVYAFVMSCNPLGCNYPRITPGQESTQYASIKDSRLFYVVPTQVSSDIKVTAPNGGEKWDMGILNSVTWTPYQYNPDINPSKDVTAYLEINDCTDKKNPGPECFRTLGKVEESGKASIHWITGELNSSGSSGSISNAAPGKSYYIRVVNNTTGAWDRSDAPFTLLAKPVDLKVSGSDGPITAAVGKKVAITWKSVGASNCSLTYAHAPYSGVPVISQSVEGSGSLVVSIAQSTVGQIAFSCYKNGSYISDYVMVNVGGGMPTAALAITSPNGGEVLDPTKSQTISWKQSGMGSLAVALYRNDQWYAWITKDVGINLQPNGSITWVPSYSNISDGDIGKPIFKIYMTGQKGDGTGYVDDKSDAPFSISSAATPTASIALSSPFVGSTYKIGDVIPVTWVVNAPANSQIILTLTNIKSTGEVSGASGGSWQSPLLAQGKDVGTYKWQTGPSFLEVPGLYELVAKIRACDPRGCNWSSENPDNLKTYAVSAPVQFTINSSVTGVPVGNALVAVLATPAAQTVASGVTVNVANYALSANGEDARFYSANVAYTDNMPTDPYNCALYNGSTVVSTNFSPVYNAPGAVGEYTMTFPTPIVVQKGTIMTLSLRCTIPPNTSGTFKFGLKGDDYFSVTGVQSGLPIKPAIVANLGNLMTVGSPVSTNPDWVGGCANPPVITGPDAYVGTPYTFDPKVTNYGAPYPGLPSGLTKSNGIIAGTPTVAGPVSVKVATGDSCGAAILKFNVLSATPVASTPAPTCTLTPNRTQYTLGDTIYVTWSSTNATSASWVAGSPDKDNVAVPSGATPLSGRATTLASVTGTPSVTLKVTGIGGVATCTAPLNVVYPKPIVSLSASAPVSMMVDGILTAQKGSTVTLSWTSTNANSCSLISSQTAITGSGLSGNLTFTIMGNTVYTLLCTNPSDITARQALRINATTTPISSNNTAKINLAAVIAAPFGGLVDILSDILVSLGIGR